MRRFLMICYFFPPMGDGGVFRSLKMARYLPALGWRPHVICGRPEDYWIRDDSLLEELPDSVAVTRVGGLTGQGLLRRLRRSRVRPDSGPGRRSSGGWRRLRSLSDLVLMPDSYAGWIPAAQRTGRRLLAAGEFELIYSSGPPDSSHVAAERLARATGLPWVADCRDPWFNLHLKSPPSALHRWLHRRLEARMMRRAQVVAVTEGWRRYYAEHCASPPVLIRNGFDPADYADLPRGPESDAGTLRILHTGKLSITRSARPFLGGLATLLAERPRLREKLRVEFIGPRESDNEAAGAEFGLSELLHWTGPLPHQESVARQCRADLLLLIKHDDSRYRNLVPGKFYEYVAARRPILAVTPAGEIESLMSAHSLGWTVRPEPERIARTLGEAVDAVTAGFELPGEAPVEMTRPHQAAQMAALFEDLSASVSRTTGEGKQ